MDRLVYVAMSGAKEILRAQAANNHNLANASTTGFRADLSAFQTQDVVGAGLRSRAYATSATTGWDASSGSLESTGRDLDVAIKGPGWLAVQASDGTEAYTRAGDLRVDPGGVLTTASGNPV
ncbi:MAG: flagellar hook-basal body complex protein, partial [Gammaproteobacteria bacterium]|nr:flagellar hook-basal body complex protein [Gammaproteobacteria bacterium]